MVATREADTAKDLSTTRNLALGGVIGPWLWTAVVLLLTVIEYETLVSFGWTPGQDNGVNYPSSLALGSAGWVQMLNFAVLGVLTIGLAVALYRVVRPGALPRVGPFLLALAGIGLVLSLFPTDHGPPDAPATWHGNIHAVAFGLALVPLLLAFFFLAFSFSGDSRWGAYGWLSPAISTAAIVCFVLGASLLPQSLGQVALYLTLLILFAGLTLIALKVRRVAA